MQREDHASVRSTANKTSIFVAIVAKLAAFATIFPISIFRIVLRAFCVHKLHIVCWVWGVLRPGLKPPKGDFVRKNLVF